MTKFLPQIALTILLLAGGGLSLAWYAPLTIDDAFITFAYAKHAALGEGLVFNRGEYVEATSSMLWAILLIPFELTGIGSLIGSKILGLVCYLSSLFFVYRAVKYFLPESKGSLLPLMACLLCAGTGAFAAWTMQGMENALVAALLIAGLYFFAVELDRREGFKSFLPIALLGLARPEGFALYVLFACIRMGVGIFRRSILSVWFLGWLGSLVGLVLVYELWGYFYFGTLLPNTVGAKVGGVDYVRLKAGFDYVLSFPCAQPGWLGGLIILGAGALIQSSFFGAMKNRAILKSAYFLIPSALLIGLQFCFAIGTGGDWMPGGRFVSHLAPLIGAGAVLLWGTCAELALIKRMPKIKIFWAVLGLLVGVGYIINGAVVLVRDRPVSAWINNNSERAILPIIKYINRDAEPGDIIACSDIGRIGYYYQGKVFDWWGLASPEVVALGQAMGKIASQTVLTKKPRYIVLYGAGPDLGNPESLGGFGGMSKPFVDDPEFVENYKSVLSTKFTDGRFHILFERVT